MYHCDYICEALEYTERDGIGCQRLVDQLFQEETKDTKTLDESLLPP